MAESDRPYLHRLGVACAVAILVAAPAAGALSGLIGAAKLAGGPPDADTVVGFIVMLVIGAVFGALTAIPLAWFACVLWGAAFAALPNVARRWPAGPALGAVLAVAAMIVSYALGRTLRFPHDFSQWPSGAPFGLLSAAAVAGVIAALVLGRPLKLPGLPAA